jgi:hypothetical protein
VEEYILRVSENRVLRRIFGPNREEVARGCRTLHNEELHNLYASPNVVRMIKIRVRWAYHLARTGEMRNAYKILVGKPEGKTRLGRTSRRWEDNIKWIFGKYGRRVWSLFIWIRIGTRGELLLIR